VLPTPGFNTHTIRGFYRWTDSIALLGGVENLGDVLYREHLDTRLNLTSGVDPDRGILRRGRSFYFAILAEY
jgi:outer membrane receptor protein involved in Fe transport